MKKSILLSCVLAVALVGTLFSLPKVVVNNKGKEVDKEKGQSAATTTAPAAAADAAESSSKSHDGAALTPDQQKVVDQLRSGFNQAGDKDKVAAGIKLSDEFAKLQKFDSAAFYAEKVALLSPAVENLMRAGDRYYEAYGFAVDEQKPWPNHTVLLGAEVLLIENLMGLPGLPENGFDVIAFPLRLPGENGGPARVVAAAR